MVRKCISFGDLGGGVEVGQESCCTANVITKFPIAQFISVCYNPTHRKNLSIHDNLMHGLAWFRQSTGNATYIVFCASGAVQLTGVIYLLWLRKTTGTSIEPWQLFKGDSSS